MGWQVPFVRRREPEYNIGSPPNVREIGPEPKEFYAGIPDTIRDGDFDGVNKRRIAQLFTTFSPWDGFGLSMGMESFPGRAFQPGPSAAFPDGHFGVDAPRRVVARPATRTTGTG